MRRANMIVVGAALLLAACTALNVHPPSDDGATDASLLDAPDAAVDAGGGGLPGHAGAAGAGNGGASPAHTGGVGGSGATATGGATASCPSTTMDPCIPNAVVTEQETCCDTGKRAHSRTCDPKTCQWGSFGAWSSCSVAAACNPGEKSACTNNDPCGNRVCTSACTWGACVPKDADGCICLAPDHADCGSNWRCGTGTHEGEAQFCLASNCRWSDRWTADCTTCGC